MLMQNNGDFKIPLFQSTLFSEQNSEFSLDLSDGIYILEKGEVRFEGSVEEFMKDEETCRAYLYI